MNVPYSKVVCDGNELAYVKEVLESGWLTTASKAKKLEETFSKMVDAQFACAVNSCTAALHLALEALKVGPGQKVFVPTMTFTATAEVIRYLGADPVFLDVEYGTSLITPSILKAAIQKHPDVKVLMVVHFGGQVATMNPSEEEGILDVCRENGIQIVEDAAHAFPAHENGRPVGSLGDITCFSFYANKTITTGEGGMLVTDQSHLADRVRVMRLHGIDRDVWNRFTTNASSWEYDVIAPGYKYNMPDINAAIGLAQLENASAYRDERERCARFYFDALAEEPHIDLPIVRTDWKAHAWHLFVIVLKEDTRMRRNELIERLREDGIGTSVHYKPLHRMAYYKERYQLAPERFPQAERIWRGCLSLPIYPSLTEEQLDYVCSSLRRYL